MFKFIQENLVGETTVAEFLERSGYRTININQGGRAGSGAHLERGFLEMVQFPKQALFDEMFEMLVETLGDIEEPYFVLFRPTFLHNHQYRRPGTLDIEGIRSREYVYTGLDGQERRGFLLKSGKGISKEEGRKQEHQIYAHQLSYGDTRLGVLFDQLDQQGLDRTIVVLYANHGSSLGDNEKFEHGVAYQSNVHVPVLIRHPGIPSRHDVTQPVFLVDLMPTLLKMVGVDSHGLEDVTEASIRRDMFGELLGSGSGREVFFGKNHWDEFVRMGKWKLIIRYGRFRELYNLDTDPGETRNLVEKNPEVAQSLEAKLLAHKLKISE